MKKFFFWIGLPMRIFFIALAWPVVLLLMPNDYKETNKMMKDIFWGRG